MFKFDIFITPENGPEFYIVCGAAGPRLEPLSNLQVKPMRLMKSNCPLGGVAPPVVDRLAQQDQARVPRCGERSCKVGR